MANERSVVVRIRAEYGQYQRDMAMVASASRKAAQETENAGRRAGSAMGRLQQDATRNRQAWDTAGNAAMGFGVVAVAAVGLAITKYAQFEQAMSNVQAATLESAGNMELLRDAAISAGADTAYSAEEAAGAIEELSKAGVSTKDILGGGLAGALSLAAAGGMEVAAAAETAASAMTQFGLSGEDIPHIADLLAAGAGKAQGSVEDLGAALNQAGLVAAATGLDIEETTGTLAAFASAGLIGSDAGTSFKTMLQRLNPTTEAAKTAMADLGISAYDAEGNFVGMESIAGQLKEGMSGLSEEARSSAMNIIFGADAVRAANVLYEQGAEGIANWTDAVDATGYAAATAAAKQDNLIGDIEKLGGAIDTALIQGGSGASDALRGLVQNVEGVVDAIGRIPAPALVAATNIIGIAGGAALAVGGMLKIIPVALDTVSAFRGLGTEGSKIPGTFGKIAKGAGIAVVAIAGLQIAGSLLTSKETKSAEEYANAILDVANAGEKAGAAGFDTLFQDFGSFAGQDLSTDINGIGDAVDRLTNREYNDGINQWADKAFGWTGFAQSELTRLEQDMGELGAAMGDLVANGGADAAAKSFNALTKEFERNGKGAQDALDLMPGYRDSLLAVGQAAGVALTDSELLELATGKMPASMQEAAKAAELAGAQYGTYTDATGEAAVVSEDMAKALEEIGVSADGTVVALDKYVEALTNAGLMTMSSRDAAFGWEETLRGIDAATQEVLATQGELGPALNQTATDFNLATDSGAKANETWQGLITTGLDVAKTYSGDVSKSQADVVQQLQGTYDAAVKSAEGFGMGATEAQNLAREALAIPPGVDIETWFSDQAILMAAETTGAIGSIPKDVQVRTAMSLAAKETADQTRQSVDDVPDQATVDTWMSDAAFQEALRTRAAALGIPEKEVIDSFMSSAARNEADNTTARVLGIPRGASVSAYMDAYIRDMANQSAAALNSIDGRTVNTYANHHNTTVNKVIHVTERNERVGVGQVGWHASGGRIPRNAAGSRLPAAAGGYRLPTTGPGTDAVDGILGLSSRDGTPVSWLDGGEWVINGDSSNKWDRLLHMINTDDPRIQGLGGLARGGRTSGSVSGLSARAGEDNWEWQDRQARAIRDLESTIGRVADWDLFEDGSGWVRTMDDTMIKIADGTWQVTNASQSAAESLGRSAEEAHWAGQTAKAAGGSFHSAGVSANAAAGTFTVAGQVTQQAAAAIIAATAKVNAGGQQRAAAQGGGLTAQAGESNAVWSGRHDQFEQAIAQKYGGIKYSSLHEDGSGQMQLDDGRLIQVENGRWQFVSKLKYGWGPLGPKLSKYAGGGRLPTTGPGTQRTDGFLGLSSMTGDPAFYADGGEWIVNGISSAKHDNLLGAINRDAPWLAGLKGYAGGGKHLQGYSGARTLHSGHGYGAAAAAPVAAAAADMRPTHATATVNLLIDGRKLHTENVRLKLQYG